MLELNLDPHLLSLLFKKNIYLPVSGLSYGRQNL